MYLKRKSCCKISSIVILLSFKFLFLPLVACRLLSGLIQLCRLKRWHGSLCRVSQPNTTSERWRFCREPPGMTLHTRKTWQVPLRHNSYQAARKRIGELREEKVSRKRVMICKKGCSQKRKYKWVFLKGVYRAGDIRIGSARRFEVKRGSSPAGLSVIM